MVEWTIKIQIADIWIQDGFELQEAVLCAAIEDHVLAGCTYDGEVQVEIVKRPTKAAIKEAMKRAETVEVVS